MSSYSISCNIAIIPPAPIARRAIAMSRRLKKGGGLFALDGKKYFPHITLYMTEFPRKNIRRVREALAAISTKVHPLSLRANGYHRRRNGYAHVHFARTSPLSTLHRAILQACNQLREGLIRQKDKERFSHFPQRQQKSLTQYGFKDVLALYHPHLTFTTFPLYASHIRFVGGPEPFSFHAAALGLFQLGEHGTCRKLLARFRLRE